MIDYKGVWHSQNSAYKEALEYVYNRQQGNIGSFKTPWSKVNEAGVDGFEWHSITVLAGRPGTGKTLIKDQIIRESSRHNKGQNINTLEWSLEMVAKASKVREFCSVLGRPYKYICSAIADDKLTATDLAILYKYSKDAVGIDKHPVDIIEKSCTTAEFVNVIKAYMEDHAVISETGVKTYTNTVITLDHSYLLKKMKGQNTKTDMLYELGEALTVLKRAFPIAFIILSQLGRGTEVPERNENGKYGNYILESDILGGDALLQHADLVIGINRPAQKFIEWYGPDRYEIKDSSVLIFHFLKTRTGDIRMSFFKQFLQKCGLKKLKHL